MLKKEYMFLVRFGYYEITLWMLIVCFTSCDNEWMLYFINRWKNERLLDVNEEFKFMLGGVGWININITL